MGMTDCPVEKGEENEKEIGRELKSNWEIINPLPSGMNSNDPIIAR